MANAENRADLVRRLRKLGVETITAEYDGSGDSGQIELPTFEPDKVAGDLRRAVQDLFYDLLERRHGGWELDEGSYGTFEWDLKADTIKLAYNMRTENYEEEML